MALVRDFAQNIQPAFKRRFIRPFRTGQEHLGDTRTKRGRRLTGHLMVDRNRTNTQHGEALLLGQVAETADAVVRPLFIRRGEQHCHAVVPRPRQREAAERRRSGQKRVRNLEQNTRSVPSVRLIAHAAP